MHAGTPRTCEGQASKHALAQGPKLNSDLAVIQTLVCKPAIDDSTTRGSDDPQNPITYVD
jgi:hypothetical protein